MTRVKPYKDETYSIFDMQTFLETKGFETRFCRAGDIDMNYLLWKEKNNPNDHWVRKYASNKLQIVNTDVYLDIPERDSKNNFMLTALRFEDYPKTIFFDQSKKVFSMLSKKFGRKKDENWSNIVDIKDHHKIQAYINQQRAR